MPHQRIETEAAPAAIGPYSQAIVAGGFLFTAGQIALDPATGKIVDGGIVEQTTRALTNLREVLAKSGATWADVVKTTVYMVDLAEFPGGERDLRQASRQRASRALHGAGCGTAARWPDRDRSDRQAPRVIRTTRRSRLARAALAACALSLASGAASAMRAQRADSARVGIAPQSDTSLTAGPAICAPHRTRRWITAIRCS